MARRYHRNEFLAQARSLERATAALLAAMCGMLLVAALFLLGSRARVAEEQNPLVVLNLLPDAPPPPVPPQPAPRDPPQTFAPHSTLSLGASRPVHRRLTVGAPLAGAPTEAPDVTRTLIDDLAATPAIGDLGAGSLTSGTGDGAGNGGRGGGSGVGDGGGGAGSLAIANWVFAPSLSDLRPFNPWKATDAHVVGQVFMACRVRLNTHAHDCWVLKERPLHYELGRAAIAASRIFRIWPARRNHRPVDDAWVGVTINYDLRDEKVRTANPLPQIVDAAAAD